MICEVCGLFLISKIRGDIVLDCKRRVIIQIRQVGSSSRSFLFLVWRSYSDRELCYVNCKIQTRTLERDSRALRATRTLGMMFFFLDE